MDYPLYQSLCESPVLLQAWRIQSKNPSAEALRLRWRLFLRHPSNKAYNEVPAWADLPEFSLQPWRLYLVAVLCSLQFSFRVLLVLYHPLYQHRALCNRLPDSTSPGYDSTYNASYSLAKILQIGYLVHLRLQSFLLNEYNLKSVSSPACSTSNNFIFIKSPGDSISGTPVNYLSIKNIFDKLLIKVSHGMFCW